MPVNTYSPSYLAHSAEWSTMRDVMEGETAVKAKGVAYIPQLSDQTEEEYKAYLKRGYFFNATARTRDALVGMVFRRDPTFTAPKLLDELKADITLTGVTLFDFAQNVLEECLDVTYGGILVDFPSVDLAQRTLAQAAAENLRPYMRLYKAESIINLKTHVVNGRVEIAQVVLEEVVSTPGNDEFETESDVQYRVLDIFEGQYRVRIFKREVERTKSGKPKANGASSFVAGPDFFPVRHGKPMTKIPFFPFGNPNSIEHIVSPVLLDLAQMNLAHYRNTVDMEHGLHFTALPTPYATGITNTDTPFKLGSTAAWLLPDPNAKAGFVEFSGQGLDALKGALQDK